MYIYRYMYIKFKMAIRSLSWNFKYFEKAVFLIYHIMQHINI